MNDRAKPPESRNIASEPAGASPTVVQRFLEMLAERVAQKVLRDASEKDRDSVERRQ